MITTLSQTILNAEVLPLLFAFIMGLAVMMYIILDGYDLGVGILLGAAKPEERDVMIASIGPFWDANETWLVLAVGVLLVAFPVAHGIILTALYLPVVVMLVGLILRGVAFEFRAKDAPRRKHLWDGIFSMGSFMATLAQGYMLALYIVGFERTWVHCLFALGIGLCLVAGYASVGASWLIMKTTGPLQKASVIWARRALWGVAGGMLAVSLVSPAVSARIFDKWFVWPSMLYLVPLPVLSGLAVLYLNAVLKNLPKQDDRFCWVPFVGNVFLFLLCFVGLAYSFYPYIVPDQLTVWQAASSVPALSVILLGAAIVVPMIFAYTVYAYRVFWGKVDRALQYH